MKKKSYEAPVVEVMESRIEKGFAGSVSGENFEWDGQSFTDSEGNTTDEKMFT